MFSRGVKNWVDFSESGRDPRKEAVPIKGGSGSFRVSFFDGFRSGEARDRKKIGPKMSKYVAGKFFNIFVVAVVVIAVVGLWDVADAKALPSEGNQT